jgi:hypothetical protein
MMKDSGVIWQPETTLDQIIVGNKGSGATRTERLTAKLSSQLLLQGKAAQIVHALHCKLTRKRAVPDHYVLVWRCRL